jgi:hypothetical protein
MDEERQEKTSGCPVCGRTRWWRSRTGARVCQQCYPDALAALILANQVDGASARGETIWAIDELSVRSLSEGVWRP